ncbi:MAG: type II toxin-antitoxin system HicA family toxin [Gemmatimonadales bacterium]
MTRLPRSTGRAVIAALRKAGFEVVRINGNHHFLRHADRRGTVVPSTQVRPSARGS